METHEVQIYRKDGLYNTDLTRKMVNNVDTVDGRELFIRTEVSDGVYNILMKGTIQEHNEQAKKILKDNQE